jgi:hypothetical protein
MLQVFPELPWNQIMDWVFKVLGVIFHIDSSSKLDAPKGHGLQVLHVAFPSNDFAHQSASFAESSRLITWNAGHPSKHVANEAVQVAIASPFFPRIYEWGLLKANVLDASKKLDASPVEVSEVEAKRQIIILESLLEHG